MKPVFVQKIMQKDRYQFTIEWTDGKISDFRLSDLQRRCSCMQCQEVPSAVDDEVQAVQIVSVGRYALRIDFTNGCSRGIYSFAFLRAL